MKKTLRQQAQHADGLKTTSRAFVLERKLVMLHTALPDLMTRRRASAHALHAEHVPCGVSWSSDWDALCVRWRACRITRQLAISQWGHRRAVSAGAIFSSSRIRDGEKMAPAGTARRRPQCSITSFRFETKARDAARGAPWSDDQETRTSLVLCMRGTCSCGFSWSSDWDAPRVRWRACHIT